MIKITDSSKKVKIIILVFLFLIILIKPTSVLSEEYRAKIWYYGGLASGTIGYPGIRVECLHLSFGVGANSKFRPGIGLGTSLYDIYSFYEVGKEKKWRGLLPVYIRFLLPLTRIKELEFSDKYSYQSVFHLFASGSWWGQGIEDEIRFGNLRWYTVGGGIDFIYGFLGLESGYTCFYDYNYYGYNYRKSSFYAGARLSLSFWFADKIEEVHPPKKPPPKMAKPTQVVAQKPTKIEEKKTITEYPIAPDFSLLSLKENIRLSLSELLGKRTVLYFWTPLNLAMKDDMLKLQKLYSKYKNKGIEIISILAFPEDKSEAIEFVNKNNITFRNLIGDREMALKYNMVDVAPGYVIIDESKRILEIKKTLLTDELIKIITSEETPDSSK